MQLSDIKGLKEKRIEKLNAAGIFKPEDLILYFPYEYIDTNAQIDFTRLKTGDSLAFVGEIKENPVRKFIRKGLSFVKAKLAVLDAAENKREVTCTWFNQPYLFKMLVLGKRFCICGKVRKFNNSVELSSPQIKTLPDEEKSIIPLYKGLKGLPQSVLTEAVRIVLDSIKVKGIFDDQTIEKYALSDFDSAVRTLHFPQNMQQIQKASYTAALENITYTICVYSLLKKLNYGRRTTKYDQSSFNKVREFIEKLPFKLTLDQQAAIKNIIDSMDSPFKMNKLIQGDVGCGKTVVAFIAMYYAVLGGYQSVLMAPTEILARQHYINAVKLFKDCPINIEFVSGSLSKTLRDTAQFNIENGVAHIIIGTHALISESIKFKNLSLVITDEQQRFGVAQRGKLENKTFGADTLVMSATPIPRTLALTLYGDLEQLQIRSMPTSKPAITTRFVPQKKVQDMMEYVKSCARADMRTYIVCPRVEDEEGDEFESVKEMYNKYLPFFGKETAGLLHGQLKEVEKAAVMRDFTEGKIKVLFTTTIIEVGIDVPEAVNIIIFNGERYGLSQLHQLRGRVGRGVKESYCFVLADEKEGEAAQRLEYFINCPSGFELAEYDFNMRGAGDFLGERQHGGSWFSAKFTPQMLKTAKEIADHLICVPQIVHSLNEKITKDESEYLFSLTLN